MTNSSVPVASYRFSRDEKGNVISQAYTPKARPVYRRLINNYISYGKYNPVFSSIRQRDIAKESVVLSHLQAAKLLETYSDLLLMFLPNSQ